MSESANQAAAPRSEILDTLSTKDRAFLLDQCQARHYSMGETIFSRGDKGNWVLLIQSGIVEVSLSSMNGRKSTLSLMEPNELLGEISLLDQQPRSADAVARTDVSGTVIQSHTMQAFLRKNPDCYMAIIRLLCARVRNASDMFETQSLTNAGARLGRSLLRVGEKFGTRHADDTTTIHSLSQADLGDLAGIARENANRYLKTWAREGIVKVEKGNISILNHDRLAEIAEL